MTTCAGASIADGVIGEARRQAKRAGMTKTDVRKAVKAIKGKD